MSRAVFITPPRLDDLSNLRKGRKAAALTPGGFAGGRSPDRADAMVTALTELVVNLPPEPRLRMLSEHVPP